jgi:hypothetical protein
MMDFDFVVAQKIKIVSTPQGGTLPYVSDSDHSVITQCDAFPVRISHGIWTLNAKFDTKDSVH